MAVHSLLVISPYSLEDLGSLSSSSEERHRPSHPSHLSAIALPPQNLTTHNVWPRQSSRENSRLLPPNHLYNRIPHRRHPNNRLRPLRTPRKHIRTSLSMAPPPTSPNPSLHGPSRRTINTQLELAKGQHRQRINRNILRPTQPRQSTCG